jgi:hypothetical protein
MALAAAAAHTGECQLRNSLPTAFIDAPRAVGDAGSTLKSRPDRWVLLPALEFLIGADVRVWVVQTHHETQVHLCSRLLKNANHKSGDWVSGGATSTDATLTWLSSA